MATKNMLHKYADTLAAMEKDAAKNLEQAKSELQKKQETRQAADAELKALEDTMKENHRGFWAAAKAILGMMYKRPETPAEIEEALEPVIGYQVALAAVPAAEEACDKAEDAEMDAQEEVEAAEEVYFTVKALGNLENNL